METHHATCVSLSGTGALLRGPSGAGKSDLALRLIDGGAMLVADDRVILTVSEGRLLAAAPDSIAGLLEVRGLGPVRLPFLSVVPVGLVADLVPGAEIERLPEPAVVRFGPVALPRIALDPFEASAPAKLRLALRLARGTLAAVA